MKNLFISICLRIICLPGILLTVSTLSVNAQTMAERSSLAAELNDALADLHTYMGSYINSNPPQPVSLPFTLTNTASVKSYDGTCTTPTTFNLVWLPPEVLDDPNYTSRLRLEVLLRNGGGEMDVPQLSHDMVCGLNTWLWHAFNGNLRQNWYEDDDDNIIMEDWAHFEINCTTSTSQKFWMVNGDDTYPPDDIRIDDRISPNIIDDMWTPGRSHNGPLDDNGVEVSGVISDAEVVHADNTGKNVWIARRHDDNDGRIQLKRAYSKIEVDYDYPDPNYEYIDPFSALFSTPPYDKKLIGIELTARINRYSPDDCPQGSTIQPHTSQAELVMNIDYVEYSQPGTVKTMTCTQEWDAVGDPDGNNQGLWGRMHGNLGRFWGEFDIDENGMLYFQTTTSCSGTSTPEKFGIIKLRSREVPADQCEMTMGWDGAFNVDPMTGDLTYTGDYNGETITEPIFCFDFCETKSGRLAFDNVIAASAQTFTPGEWTYDADAHGLWSDGHDGGANYDPGVALDPYIGMPDNDFQRGRRGKWRPDKAYAYRAGVKSGVGGEKVYDNAGLFVDELGSTLGAFDLFNWRDPGNNADNWLNPTTITQYAPTGESVEEHNILDIYSTAHLAHNGTVPNLVALNATYNAVDFESFEDRNWWSNWDGSEGDEWHPGIVETYAHSGERSFLLDVAGALSTEIASVTLTPQINTHGLLLKFWVKQNYNVYDANPSFSDPPVTLKFGGRVFTTPAPDNYNTLDEDLIHKVAQTGEWSLYQLYVKNFNVTEGSPLSVLMTNNLSAYSDSVWIDDVRMQPLDASMSCFVYDRHTLRPVAQFDDQHFGVYSRYNGEGTVVSVLRETERGVVTVAESQGWVKTQPRHVGAGAPGAILSGGDLLSSAHGMNVGPIGMRSDYDDNFSIMNLQIGPQGPTAQLFSGDKLPMDDLGGLLDFRKEFPDLDTKRLAELAPDLSDVQRLQLVKELTELDEERRELTEDLQEMDEAAREEEIAKRLDRIDQRRNEILREELGLSDEDITRLYEDLKASDNGAEE